MVVIHQAALPSPQEAGEVIQAMTIMPAKARVEGGGQAPRVTGGGHHPQQRLPLGQDGKRRLEEATGALVILAG